MEINTLLLWMQGGLLGAITPYLRAVTVNLDTSHKKQIFYFYYDCDITDELFELASVASTEASCSCDYFSEDHIVKLEFPKKIPIHGLFAYLRKEEGIEQYIQKKFSFDISNRFARLRLYVQQAMLGRVTGNLRELDLEFDEKEKKIGFYFIYDGAISSEDKMLVNDIIEEASKPFEKHQIKRHLERVDYPKSTPHYGQWMVYSRYEDTSLYEKRLKPSGNPGIDGV